MTQKLSVCIIDDDAIQIFTIKKTLALSGYTGNILVYRDGKEAFDHLDAMKRQNESLPELVFLDLNMPIWNGWDFLDAFSEVLSSDDVHTYLLSSSAYPEDIQKAKNYPVIYDYLVKPLSIDKLKEILGL